MANYLQFMIYFLFLYYFDSDLCLNHIVNTVYSLRNSKYQIQLPNKRPLLNPSIMSDIGDSKNNEV